jgi:hypothetical protein
MIMVDISIIVVMSGPDAAAGSRPTFLIETGIILEKNVPVVIEHQTDKAIIKPNNSGL